ncbi:MAG: hypothetical protein Q4G04_00595 [bacterium]|nr:hypothetical protein [bacterium]
MEDNFVMNSALENYLLENISTIIKCDVEEKKVKYPYTREVSNMFQKLKFIYDIDFDEKLISEDLLDKMIDEIEENIQR